jgi:hypothetical protein
MLPNLRSMSFSVLLLLLVNDVNEIGYISTTEQNKLADLCPQKRKNHFEEL